MSNTVISEISGLKLYSSGKLVRTVDSTIAIDDRFIVGSVDIGNLPRKSIYVFCSGLFDFQDYAFSGTAGNAFFVAQFTVGLQNMIGQYNDNGTTIDFYLLNQSSVALVPVAPYRDATIYYSIFYA